ncbi:hypothetical protein A5780_07090 [Nocardia sp. 852002-20019_SCH5090214]|jgi:hypothetical protein|uniref:Uncharacterized protein n=2 Tax=Nocardia TaxID=1817 RepID=A0A2S6AJ06_9NOCA|nr:MULTISPECIES: hypothetical protein [Nocardia]OBF79523.1 hypothetical protein A9X06_21715 [Mycobacterium sp. 852002-51759_SCH5129042]MBF4997595.1 hypothetical protein [Nocardia sp. BSTN01]MBF6278523.1 hypothetical protein [Nocardia nova]MBV7707238.1 hypothetical protein [Nocardia nova]OBA40344.1 hypothetical protein A5780_07090 [Nocardia sp. 852002-20019_SCH5090214]
MHNLNALLYYILLVVRALGIIVITILAMGILISEAAKSKLSPTKVLGVVGSAILAAVLFWMLPTLVNYARSDATSVVPDQPVGRYR